MKAIVWNDESLGAKFEVTDIPEDMKEKADEVCHCPRTTVAQRGASAFSPGGSTAAEEAMAGPSVRQHHRPQSSFACALRSGAASCSRRSSSRMTTS